MFNLSDRAAVLSNRRLKIYDGYLDSSNIHHVVIVESLALLGFVIMLVGYRYLRLAMFTCGFWLAFCLFYVFSPIFIHTQYCCDKEKFHTVHTFSSIAVGALGGLFTASLYRFGVFLIGKCLGILIGMMLIQTVLVEYLPSHILMTAFVAMSAVMFGSMTWRCEKPLLILSTSCIGSFMVICGVDIFTRTQFSLLVLSGLIYIRDAFLATYNHRSNLKLEQLPKLDAMQYYNSKSSQYMVAWLSISVLSSIIQYRVTAKHAREGGDICPVKVTTICKCILPCCFDCKRKDMDTKILK